MLGIVETEEVNVTNGLKTVGGDLADKADSGMDEDSPPDSEEALPTYTDSDDQPRGTESPMQQDDDSEEETVLKRRPNKKKLTHIFDDDDESNDSCVKSDTNENNGLQKKLTAEEALDQVFEKKSDNDLALEMARVKKKGDPKVPMSPRSRMRKHREKMKENETIYQKYLQKQKLQSKLYRLNMATASEEKKLKHREAANERQRKRRRLIKEKAVAEGHRGGGDSKIKTRAVTDKQREYWKKKKRESRQRRTSQKLRRVREKDAAYRRTRRNAENMKRQNKQSTSVPSYPETPETDFETAQARRQAAYRVRKCLPTTSAAKFASAVKHIINNSSKMQKVALKEKGVCADTIDHQLSKCFQRTVLELKHRRHAKDRAAKQHLFAVARMLKKYRSVRNFSKQSNISWSSLMRASKIPEEPQLAVPLIQSRPRKRRFDAVSENATTKVETHYKNPLISRELPTKKSVKKRKLEAAHVLEVTVKEAHKQFTAQNPEEKISLSKFAALRPRSVKLASTVKQVVCLCEYCTNVELKLKCLNNKCRSLNLTDLTFENKYSVLAQTLCPTTEKYFDRDCIERKCSSCGVTSLEEHYNALLGDHGDETVTWKAWEYAMQESGQKRRELCDHAGSVKELLAALSQELDPFAAHLHNARWQYQQFMDLQVKLPENWVMLVMDFAQNYTVTYQDEIQSAHWVKKQVTIHPVVCFYRCNDPSCQNKSVIRESVVIISNDVVHDCHAVHRFIAEVLKYLSKRLSFKHLVQFSDGCGRQYKSITPFVDVSCANEDQNCSMQRCFFGSRHGKSPCDGEGGVVKCAVSRAVLSRRTVVRSAKEFFEYCDETLTKQANEEECCHSRRKFIFVENIDRDRNDRSQYSTLKGTMKLHEVSSTIQGRGEVECRNLSCFCPACMTRKTGCQNSKYVDTPVQKTLRKLKTSLVSTPSDNGGENLMTTERTGDREDVPGLDGKCVQPALASTLSDLSSTQRTCEEPCETPDLDGKSVKSALVSTFALTGEQKARGKPAGAHGLDGMSVQYSDSVSGEEDVALSDVLSKKKKSRIKHRSFIGDDDDQSEDESTKVDAQSARRGESMTFDSNIFDAETDSDNDGRSSSDSDRSGDEGYEDSEQPISDKLKARLKKGAAKKPSTRKSQREERESIQDLHSETQRLVREARVNIPYHQPKPKSLNDFLSSAREKQASLKTLRGAAGFRSTSWYEEKEKQRLKLEQEKKEQEKIVQEKIEQEKKERDTQEKCAATVSVNPVPGGESGLTLAEGHESEVTEKRDLPQRAVGNIENFDELPDLVVEVDTGNVQLQAERDESMLHSENELPDISADNEFKQTRTNDVNSDSVCEPADKDTLTCSKSAIKDNVATSVSNVSETDNNNIDVSSSTSIDAVAKVDSLNSSGVELFEDVEEGVVATVISPGECMDTNKLNTNSAVDLKNEIENESRSVSQGIHRTPILTGSKSKLSSTLTPKLMALSTVDLGAITPKLSGSPDTVISFDDGDATPTNPGVAKLMSRFVSHNKKRTPQSKDHSICVVQKEKGSDDKEELRLSTVVYHADQPEDSTPNTTPGGKLVALKEQLAVQMRVKREEARQKRVELYQLDNEEGYQEGGPDSGDEEAEMTDGSDTESEDGDYQPGDAVIGAEVGEEEREEEEPFADDEEDMEADDVAGDDSDISDGDDDNQSLKLELSDEENADEQDDKIKPVVKGRKPRALAISDDEESQNAPDVEEVKTDAESAHPMNVSFESEPMTPFTKHISLATQPESNQRSRPLNLPIEDSQDLYATSLGEDNSVSSQGVPPQSQVNHFLSDDTQSQMLDADGFFKVNSTDKKPKPPGQGLLKPAFDGDSAMDELLGLCSGRFVSQAPEEKGDKGVSERGASRSLFSQPEHGDDNAQTGDMDELLGLCSGRFPGSTQLATRSQKSGWIKRRPVGEDEDSDSDSDSQGSFVLLSDAEGNKENIDKDELSSDEEGGAADSDSALMPAPSFVGFTKKGNKRKILREFVEDEAELSGSECDSDENLDLPEEEDIMMAEEGDKDVGLSEEELRNQVGRVHMKKLMDEDNREMRRLQEMYLPDGDLHSDGKGRMRRFRWSNVDEDTQEDMFGAGSGEEEGPGEDEDSQWRAQRHERDKWIQEQQEAENEENSNSQFMKFGKLILRQKNKVVPEKEVMAVSVGDAKTEKPVPPKLPAPASIVLSQKRGSFLSRGKVKLAKIAERTKAGVNTNASRNSKNFVFKPLSPEAEVKKPKPAVKRACSTPGGPEVPSAKRPKTRVEDSLSQNSIFNLLH